MYRRYEDTCMIRTSCFACFVCCTAVHVRCAVAYKEEQLRTPKQTPTFQFCYSSIILVCLSKAKYVIITLGI